MATGRASRNGNDQDGLQAAMTKLIQNQAQFGKRPVKTVWSS